jgi:hydrogenase maturation factor
MGKLGNEELKKLLSCIKKDPRVVVPPTPGYDAGVHLLDDKYLVVAADPCIGVPAEWFGWLLVNYAASDVALFGSKPEFCTITLLGPPSTKPSKFQTAMRQVCDATDELGMAIVRGHTGTYDGVARLVAVCTAYGTVEKGRLITPSGARAGDLILCTKSIGLETLINLSLTEKTLSEKLFGAEATEKLASLVKAESCVTEALKLAEIKAVHAMHDATEGGFVAALNEMAEASNLGFRIDWENLPISTEARALQKHFRLSDGQLLSMSSTGTILAAVDPADKEKVENALSAVDVSASFVGQFTKNKTRTLVKNKREMDFPQAADDPYALILSGKNPL